MPLHTIHGDLPHTQQSAPNWIHQARQHYQNNEMLPAKEALEHALKLLPQSPNVWDMLGDVHHALSRENFTHIERAIECCKASLAIEPKVASTWTNLAKVLTEAGRHEEAIDATKKALDLEPSFRSGYQRAEALLSAKRHPEAQAEYRKLIARADAATQPPQQLADVHNHLAVSLLASAARPNTERHGIASLREAIEQSRRALRLLPACPYAHAHNYYQVLASGYNMKGRLDLATATLWPVAAISWGRGSTADSAEYARAGFRALAWMQHQASSAAAATSAGGLTREAMAQATLEEWKQFAPASMTTTTEDKLWTVDGFAKRMATTSEASSSSSEEPASVAIAVGADGSSNDAKTKPSAAIVYLCCADEAEIADLHKSIRLLYLHVNYQSGYPVFIFHDILTPQQEESLRSAGRRAAWEAISNDPPHSSGLHGPSGSPKPIEMVFIGLRHGDGSKHKDDNQDNYLFSLPPHLPPEMIRDIPESIRGYGYGYRHMCRFFSGPLFNHPALRAYEYVWRLDSDSFILGKPIEDPVQEMADKNATYGWIHAYRDEQMFVAGLWDVTVAFLNELTHNDTHPEMTLESKVQEIDEWVPGDGTTWQESPMCFATNCFIAKLSFFRGRYARSSMPPTRLPATVLTHTPSPLSSRHRDYSDYFKMVDRAGGFYTHRWGDACVHMLGVAALLRKDETLRLRGLPYWHQGTVVLPAEQHAAGLELLGGRAEPPFAVRHEGLE